MLVKEKGILLLFFKKNLLPSIAGSRVYVEDRIYDEFVEKSAKLASQRKLGDPFDSNTTQGPQISQEQMDKILSYVQSGKKQGANLVVGGSRFGDKVLFLTKSSFEFFDTIWKGYYVQPTIFKDVKDEMQISQEEIFGPVMSISKFSGVDEVIRRANKTNYGLGNEKGQPLFTLLKKKARLSTQRTLQKPTLLQTRSELALFMSTHVSYFFFFDFFLLSLF